MLQTVPTTGYEGEWFSWYSTVSISKNLTSLPFFPTLFPQTPDTLES